MASAHTNSARTGVVHRMFSALYAARVVFIWLLLAVGLAMTIGSAWNWYVAWRETVTIRALVGGEDVAVDPERASPPVLFARAYYLLKRDRFDEAQILLDHANFRGDPKTRVAMVYNDGNSRLRASFQAIERGDFEKATSLVNLAKDNYNHALRLDPGAWDVKYNLDVAARLVRDLPLAHPSEDPLTQVPRSDLWSDLPGVPRGAP